MKQMEMVHNPQQYAQEPSPMNPMSSPDVRARAGPKTTGLHWLESPKGDEVDEVVSVDDILRPLVELGEELQIEVKRFDDLVKKRKRNEDDDDNEDPKQKNLKK